MKNLKEQYKKLFKGKTGSNDKGLLKEVEVQPAGATPYMQVTVEVNVPLFEAAVEAAGANLIVDLTDANQLKQLALIVEEDLQSWFERNSDQWLEEGMSEGVYDDFVTL